MNHRRVTFLAWLVLLVATPSIAYASDPSLEGLGGHIRTTDDRLRRLLEQGARISPTFRALVHRLINSDVVVYLWCDGTGSPGTDGRLTFVSTVGGYRYIVVRLTRLASRVRQIAIIAHELRHAVEIADASDVVDSESLEREYRRIGYVSSAPFAQNLAFDTNAAIDAGAAVLRELTAGDEY